MEKFSSIERVVGNIPEAEKEQILQEKEKMFDSQVFFENLKGREREKTSEELRIISLVNQATNAIRRRYGLEYFDIPPKNIHIVSEETWLELVGKREVALFYRSMAQGIVMREQPVKLVFAEKLFHDILHFKSYNALQVTIGENPELARYRIGLTVSTRDSKKIYFVNFNEAVTEEIIKRSAKRIFNNPLFAKELKQTRDILTKYPQIVAMGSENQFSFEDIYYAEIGDKKLWGEAVGRLLGAKEKTRPIDISFFTYQLERKILHTLIDKIFEKNSQKFKNKEAIFEVFAKGIITGNILPVGKLIDTTFGRGTLRQIGELDQNIQAQEEFVNSL